jgi:hypothetical protein
MSGRATTDGVVDQGCVQIEDETEGRSGLIGDPVRHLTHPAASERPNRQDGYAVAGRAASSDAEVPGNGLRALSATAITATIEIREATTR